MRCTSFFSAACVVAAACLFSWSSAYAQDDSTDSSDGSSSVGQADSGDSSSSSSSDDDSSGIESTDDSSDDASSTGSPTGASSSGRSGTGILSGASSPTGHTGAAARTGSSSTTARSGTSSRTSESDDDSDTRTTTRRGTSSDSDDDSSDLSDDRSDIQSTERNRRSGQIRSRTGARSQSDGADDSEFETDRDEEFSDVNRRGRSERGRSGREGIARGRVRSSDFGLSFSTDNNRLRVNRLERRGLAGRAGIRQGDVIVSINGTRITTEDDYNGWVRTARPGTRVTWIVLRDGEEQTIYSDWEGYDMEEGDSDYASDDIPGEGSQASLGVTLDNRYQQAAVVSRIAPDSPAERAGLRVGDYIVSVDGQRVSSPDDLINAIQDQEPGATVEIEFTRRQRQNLEVTLESRRGGSERIGGSRIMGDRRSTGRIYTEDDDFETRGQDEEYEGLEFDTDDGEIRIESDDDYGAGNDGVGRRGQRGDNRLLRPRIERNNSGGLFNRGND